MNTQCADLASTFRTDRAIAVDFGRDCQIRATRPLFRSDRRLGRPRRQIQGRVRLDHHPPRGRPRRRDRCFPRRRRLGLCGQLAPGRADGQSHRARVVCRGGDFGRDSALGGNEGLEDDCCDQQGECSGLSIAAAVDNAWTMGCAVLACLSFWVNSDSFKIALHRTPMRLSSRSPMSVSLPVRPFCPSASARSSLPVF